MEAASGQGSVAHVLQKRYRLVGLCSGLSQPSWVGVLQRTHNCIEFHHTLIFQALKTPQSAVSKQQVGQIVDHLTIEAVIYLLDISGPMFCGVCVVFPLLTMCSVFGVEMLSCGIIWQC